MYQNCIPFYGQIVAHLWIYHIMFMHSSLYGHLSSFHFLALMSNAGMNVCSKFFLTEQSGLTLILHCIYLLVHMSLIFYLVKSHIVGFSPVPPCWMFEIWVLWSVVWSVHSNLVHCASWLNLHCLSSLQSEIKMLFSTEWLLSHMACDCGGGGSTSFQPLVCVQVGD